MNYNIDNLFSLSITQKITATKITMIMYSNQINTSNLPNTFTRLEKLLPSVLLTECYNDENLPFAIEVRNTEIGHLFEHILIEYLCQLKIAKGHNSAVFSGRTRWNWIKDPRGMFHIYLDCGQKDAELLPIALQKTIKLMKIILRENNASFFNLNLQRFSFLNNGLKNGKKYFLRTRHKKA